MNSDTIFEQPASDLFNDLNWLSAYISEKIRGSAETPALKDPGYESVYGKFVHDKKLSHDERLILLLAIAPYIRPEILDLFAGDGDLIRRYRLYKQEDSICLLPTVQTALILLAGENSPAVQHYLELFDTEHIFYRQSILEQKPLEDVNIPNLNLLSVSSSYRDPSMSFANG
jgi:hypothetical protein